MTPPMSEPDLENLLEEVSEMKGQTLASALEHLARSFSCDHRNYWLLGEAAKRLRWSKARRA
jgi:hypothetical protein